MPVDNTPFTPPLTRFAYISPTPPPNSWLTPIPRGEAIFSVFFDTIAAPSAGDSQSMSITCALPTTFAYILMEATVEIYDAEVGDTADWDPALRATVRESASQGEWIATPRMDAGAAFSISAILKGKVYQMLDPPKKMIIPKVGGGEVFFAMQNTSVDGGPMTCNALVKLLEFDLNQAHYYAVNTPVPVR